ncbi:MAG: Ig-like domain-containing protein [Novosphingobium sp.]
MPSFAPIDSDTLVNTDTPNGQISPQVVALAGGKYMVIWVGPVVLPVTVVNGTIAGSYTNADIRAQIFNADGTRSGGEIVINTTTANAQLRPIVAQLSDGNVLISWHDGVGPSGGPSENVVGNSNTIRAQEFTSTGAPAGAEFTLGNSNGRLHSVAPTANGGFVVTYEEGGAGGAFPVGNVVAKVFNANNTQTSSFIVDNTQTLSTTTYTTVEADGDIVVAWLDRVFGLISWNFTRFDSSGTVLGSGSLPSSSTVYDLATLATGGHIYLGANNPGNGQPVTIFAQMNSVDGSLSQFVEIAQVQSILATPVLTQLANGGFMVTWGVDSDPGSGFNVELMARAFNAIGNPIGPEFQLNSIATGNQTSPSIIQLTNGEVVAAWVDESQLNGDASGTGINLRRVHFDPTNHNPTASNFSFSLYGVAAGTDVTEDPANIAGFFGPDGYDQDGDPLIVTSIANVANGTVTLNPDGTLTMNATPGAPGRLSFDYTISDGQGGFATARATVNMPSDFISIRPGETALLDFLANDFYVPGPGASGFIVTSPGPVGGGTAEGSTALVSTPSGPRIYYNPLGNDYDVHGLPALNSSYFDLLLGQTTQVQFFYYNNETASIQVNVTLQGWTQLGGTGADNLVGSAAGDHLSGGTGAANTLTGGGGDDWYTVAVAGDTIIENPGEGTDTVRTALSTFTLPDNVENLRFMGDAFSTSNLGIGNGGNNLITAYAGVAAELRGLGGDDRLIGGLFDDLLDGGSGADVLDGWFGTDTVTYANSASGVTVNLATNVNTGGDAQGDTLFFIERIIGSTHNDSLSGSTGFDTLEGNGGIDTLFGDAGNDLLVLTGAGSGSSVDGGADFDTLAISGAVSLASITSIEAIELTAGSNLTLTTSQLMAGLAANTVLSGSGTITVNLETNVFTAMTGFQGVGAPITFVLNGSAGDDYIKASHFNNTINGGTGRDFIRGGNGIDTIDGGADNDKITGWGGADVLTGGSGADQFRYFYATDSGLGAASDRITDFTIGSDVIDLRLLDKDLVTPDIQNYTLSFIGSSAFGAGGAGQIRYAASGADMLVQFDLDGNGTSDMEIVLQGLAGQTLSVNDFLFGTNPTGGSEPIPGLAASEPANTPTPDLAAALTPNGAALVPIDTLRASPVIVMPIELLNDPMALPGHGLDLGLTQHADLLHMI